MACPASWRRIRMHHVGCAAFDFEHLGALELLQPRMREVERDRDAGHAVGREPFVRQPVVRLERPGRARRARAASSAMRGSSTVPSIVTPSCDMRRSSSFSSGHAAHSSGGMAPERSRRVVMGLDGHPTEGAAVQSSSVEPSPRCGIPRNPHILATRRVQRFFTVCSRLLMVGPISGSHEFRHRRNSSGSCGESGFKGACMKRSVASPPGDVGVVTAAAPRARRSPAGRRNRAAAAQQPATPAADQPARASSPRLRRRAAEVRRNGRRQRVADRGKAGQRPGDDDGHQRRSTIRARRRRTSPSCCAPSRA